MKSLSDSTSTCDVASSLWLSVDVFSSNSTASSNVGLSGSVSLSSGVGLTSCINWTSSISLGISWSSNILSGTLNESSLSNAWSLNNWRWDWNVTGLVNGFSSDSTLGWNVGGTSSGVTSFNVTGLDVLTLAWDVVVSFWVVDNLGFNWQILNSFPDSFDWFIFNDSLFDFFWNIFDLSFNGIIIGNGSFDWDSFSSGDFFIFNDFSFIWNSFNSFDLIVFNIFLFEWNVLNSWFDWDLFGNDFLGQALSKSWISTSWGLEGLVNKFVVLWDLTVGGLSLIKWGVSTYIWATGNNGLGGGIGGSLISWWGNSLSSSDSCFGGGIGGGVSNGLGSGISSGVFIEEASVLFLWHGFDGYSNFIFIDFLFNKLIKNYIDKNLLIHWKLWCYWILWKCY